MFFNLSDTWLTLNPGYVNQLMKSIAKQVDIKKSYGGRDISYRSKVLSIHNLNIGYHNTAV